MASASADKCISAVRRSTRSVVLKNRHLSLYAEESDSDDKENSQVTAHAEASQEGSNLDDGTGEKLVQRSKKRTVVDLNSSGCAICD